MTIKKAKRKLPLHDYSIVKATVPFSELCSDSLSSAFGHAYISRLSHLLQNLIKNSFFMRKPKYATSFTIFSCHAILDTTVPLERVIPDARKELISNRKMRVGITRRAYLKIKKRRLHNGT
jgi:hypothetical protein